MGGGDSVVKFSYLQLTWPGGWSAMQMVRSSLFLISDILIFSKLAQRQYCTNRMSEIVVLARDY